MRLERNLRNAMASNKAGAVQSRLPLGILWGNRGAPPRGPPETAGGFRPFPFCGACRAGLQLADFVAHPSRLEILNENGHAMTLAPFATKVIAVLQGKYDQGSGKVLGKKML